MKIRLSKYEYQQIKEHLRAVQEVVKDEPLEIEFDLIKTSIQCLSSAQTIMRDEMNKQFHAGIRSRVVI